MLLELVLGSFNKETSINEVISCTHKSTVNQNKYSTACVRK